MDLDFDAITKTCGGKTISGRQFCGAESERVRIAMAQPGPITIACTAPSSFTTF
jgi:hypothetical protein